jgi:hypothetical protein
MNFQLDITINKTHNNIPHWVNYIAIDFNGGIHGYENEPFPARDLIWVVDNGRQVNLSYVDLYSKYWLGSVEVNNWTETLIGLNESD